MIVISDLEFGGAQRQVIELANFLAETNVTAYVCSLSSYVPLADTLRNRERLHVVERRFRLDVTVVFRLAWLLWRLKADVVHAFLFDAEIASRLAGFFVPGVVVIGSERNTDYRLKRTDRWFLRWTKHRQDRVIANSRAGAEFNAKLIGLPADRYRVVRNGVNTRTFRPGRSSVTRAQLGIPDDAPVVGVFASFKPQKNHGLLLRAAAEIVRDHPRVRFLFVGDALHRGMSESDDYKRRLADTVHELRLTDYCVFARNRLDVERLYPLCDVTVLPSLFEGTPNVLLESMACGVPVVATDVSDNRELVPEGEVGYIVPINDERALAARVSALLTDESLRSAMSGRAREWAVRQLSSERLAERTADVYREVVGARQGATGREPLGCNADERPRA